MKLMVMVVVEDVLRDHAMSRLLDTKGKGNVFQRALIRTIQKGFKKGAKFPGVGLNDLAKTQGVHIRRRCFFPK